MRAVACVGSGALEPAGNKAFAAYTPRVRRLICIAALVGRFSGQGYVWRVAPPPRPVPIERSFQVDPRSGVFPAWWLAR